MMVFPRWTLLFVGLASLWGCGEDAPINAVEAAPAAKTQAAPPDWSRRDLAPGETLAGMLAEAGLQGAELTAVLEAAGEELDLRRLRPGLAMDYRQWQGWQFRIRRHRDKWLRLHLGEDGKVSRQWIVPPHRREVRYAWLTIESSLSEAAMAADLPMEVAERLRSIWRRHLDLRRDLQPGDRVGLAYVWLDYQDGTGKNGPVLLSRLEQADGARHIMRFPDEAGLSTYFLLDGSSVDHPFTGIPVDGGWMTSSYGWRIHPVLKRRRMHRGLDFTGQEGAAVRALANGVVVEANRFGSFGNQVVLRHDNGLRTRYAHLKAIAPDVAPGERLRYGDVLGVAGASGLATGTNVHYEIIDGRRAIDPDGMDLPPRDSLRGERLAAFHSLLQARVQRLLLAESGKSIVWVQLSRSGEDRGSSEPR